MKPVELTREALSEFPLPPVTDADKDDHGKLLIIAGSKSVPGSAVLAGQAALRSGTGKLRIATVESVAPAMALHMVEALIAAVPEDRDGDFSTASLNLLQQQIGFADAIVAGPGMRQRPAAGAIAKMVLAQGTPAALDAAMLHCLEPLADDCRKSRVPPILLPHSREMAALLGISEDEVERDRLAAARNAVEQYGAIVLAKGAISHVVAPDGRAWTWRGGVPGLGVAGSGDVLAGIVGALLARGADPLTALLWGVLLHGEAGEMLSEKVGPVGFLAREIPDEIPALLAR